MALPLPPPLPPSPPTNDNYDHSLAPGFIEFSGKQFVFEDHSWPFKQNSYDTLLLDPTVINIIAGTGSQGSTCPTDTTCTPTGIDNAINADELPAISNILAYRLTNGVTNNSSISLAATNRINVNAPLSLGLNVNITLETTCPDSANCTTTDGIYINENIRLQGTGNLTIDSAGLVSINTATINGATGSVSITAGTNITSDNAANTITSGNGNITLVAGNVATTGSIGTEDDPITLAQTSTSNNITATADNNIYLRSAPTLRLGTITAGTATNDTIDIRTTAGNIFISSSHNVSSATVTLNAAGTNAYLDSLGTITASTISITSADTIGADQTSAIRIARDSGTWSADNLTLVAGGPIYLRTASAGAHTAIPADFAHTFYLQNPSGSVEITSPINRPDANITLAAVSNSGSVILDDNAITANNFSASVHPFGSGNITGGTITATTINLQVRNGSVGTTANPVTIAGGTTGTITANSIVLTATGAIGTSANPLTIAKGNNLSDWIGTGDNPNLTLSIAAGNDIYLRTATAGALSVIPSNLGSGTFSLNQTSGNISISSINHPDATIILNASDTDTAANINFADNNITASSLSLAATGTITGTTGTFTADSITLTAANDINSIDTLTATNTININAGFLASGLSDLTLTTNCTTCPDGAGIYINGYTSSSGHITITSTSLVSINTATISSGKTLRITADSNITSTAVANTLIGDRLILRATNGSIGTLAIPLTITRGPDGTWRHERIDHLTLTAGSDIYLKTPRAEAHRYIPANFAGTFSLNQTAGDISIAADIDFSSANIMLNASDTSGSNGNISFTTFDIDASSISLTANRNITATTGVLTAATGGISLTATTGSIGNSTNSITLAQTATTNAITATAEDDIYLRSTSALRLGALTADTINSNLIEIRTTAGNIALTGAITADGVALTADDGSITSDNMANAITAITLFLTVTNGNIGASGAANHIRIERSAGTSWVSNTTCTGSGINLCLRVGGTAGGNIYLRTAATGALTALTARPTNFANTFSLNQTADSIHISSAVNFPSATIILNASDTSDSNGNITSSSSANTITAGTLSLTATGSIGEGTAVALNIARSTGNWVGTGTTPNLTLSAGGDIYLRTAAAGAYTAIPADFARLFYLDNSTPTLTLTSDLNRPDANIEFSLDGANGSIILGDNAITANSFSVTISSHVSASLTGGTITAGTIDLRVRRGSVGTTANPVTIAGGTTGTITANSIVLTATGAIGTSANPLTIAKGNNLSDWIGTGDNPNLTLSIAAGNDIYLRTATLGALSAIPSNLGSGTFSLNQTGDSIAVVSPINFPSATIILNASDTSAGNGNLSFSNAAPISVSSLTLEAAGAITIIPETLTAINRLNINAAIVLASDVSLNLTTTCTTCATTDGIYINNNITLSGAGGLTITSTGLVSINPIDATTGTTINAGDGAINITAGTTVSLNGTSAASTTISTSDVLSITAGTAITSAVVDGRIVAPSIVLNAEREVLAYG